MQPGAHRPGSPVQAGGPLESVGPEASRDPRNTRGGSVNAMEGQGVMVPVNVLDFTGPLLVSTSQKVGRANAQGRRGEKGRPSTLCNWERKEKTRPKSKVSEGKRSRGTTTRGSCHPGLGGFFPSSAQMTSMTVAQVTFADAG